MRVPPPAQPARRRWRPLLGYEPDQAAVDGPVRLKGFKQGSGGRAGRLRRPQALQVHHDALLAAAGDDHDRLAVTGVLLAVRDVGRDEDVVAGPGLQADLLVAVGEDEDGSA